ncbi:MAG: M16 family metallopeptidase, partial [Planctomycetaceae bacterium]
ELIARIRDIYEDVNRQGVTPVELEQARNKIASGVVLGSERPRGRLRSLGGNWLYRREYRPVETDLQTVQSVTVEDIRRLLDEYPLGTTTTAAVGPLEALGV